MFKILVVDDNINTLKLMEIVLYQNGFEPLTAENSDAAIAVLDREKVDLIVLDIMLPGMDGYEFARFLRKNDSMLPILMVTAKDSVADKREGFLSGTDDYMTKPVDEVELILRIKALLRRAKIADDHKIELDHTVLDYDSFTVTENGESYVLPKKEFLLLFKLLSYPNKTFTRTKLMDEFWSLDTESEARTVDVHINRLRDKFRDNPDFEIITVRGLGYKAVKK